MNGSFGLGGFGAPSISSRASMETQIGGVALSVLIASLASRFAGEGRRVIAPVWLGVFLMVAPTLLTGEWRSCVPVLVGAALAVFGLARGGRGRGNAAAFALGALMFGTVQGCNDSTPHSAVRPDPLDPGQVHNEILTEVDRRIDLTSDARLDWEDWSTLMVESAASVAERHGMEAEPEEMWATIVEIERIFYALEHETGVDVRSLRTSPTAVEDFEMVVNALQRHGFIEPEAAQTVIDEVAAGKQRGFLAAETTTHQLPEAAAYVLGIGAASSDFWLALEARSPEPPADGEKQPCTKCGANAYGTLLSDMVGSIIARKLCRGLPWCADIGSAAASAAYIAVDAFCETHDCHYEYRGPACRPCW